MTSGTFKRLGKLRNNGEYEDTSPKATQVCNLRLCGWFFWSALAFLLLSSYSPALNVSRCFRIAVFIGFVFVVLRNVNDVFLY